MKATDERKPLAQRLKSSLTEGIEFAQGTTGLKQTVVPLERSYSGEEVASIRAKRGLTQAQFAAYLRVPLKTLQSWEQGLRKPSKPTMRLLQIFDEPEAFRELLAVSEDRARYGTKKQP